jgi:hypothetical protein
MDCGQELALGRAAFAGRDYRTALVHFGRAHAACHDDNRLHQASHWGMARALLRQGLAWAALKQWVLGVFTPIFN